MSHEIPYSIQMSKSVEKPLPASSAGRTCYAWAAAVAAVVLGADAVPGMAVAVPTGSG